MSNLTWSNTWDNTKPPFLGAVDAHCLLLNTHVHFLTGSYSSVQMNRGLSAVCGLKLLESRKAHQLPSSEHTVTILEALIMPPCI